VERTAEILTAHLSELLGLRLVQKDEVASFFGYLLNLEPWSLCARLQSPERVDTQLVQSSVEWHEDHLRVGKQ
jgi:type IV secretion system protein VirB4